MLQVVVFFAYDGKSIKTSSSEFLRWMLSDDKESCPDCFCSDLIKSSFCIKRVLIAISYAALKLFVLLKNVKSQHQFKITWNIYVPKEWASL